MTAQLPDGIVVASRSVDPQRFDLVSVPGGWVELIEMSYGDKLRRQDIAMRMQVKMAQQGNKQTPDSMDFGMANVETTSHDFRVCIYRHNLGNEKTGRLIDFKNPADWMANLNPRIGTEIDDLIGKLNAFNESDFTPPQNGTSSQGQDQPTPEFNQN